jgi:hypothetical protein
MNFPEVQDMRERGKLMYQHALQMMGPMQDIPDPIRLMRFMTDIPEESPPGLSIPNFINPGNNNGSNNSNSIRPPVWSPTCVTIQPEASRVSVGAGVPNPLSELINIYSDDESPETSLNTPMQIQEEKGPEKAASHDPEVQTQEIPRKEKEAKNVLDIKNLEVLETRADDLKGKSEPDEPKGGSPQKEVGNSTADEQVSIEYFPDVSISLDTQIPDKWQVEAKSLEYNEKVQEHDLEQVYTTGNMGNTLTWGDQQIPEPEWGNTLTWGNTLIFIYCWR